MKTLTLKETRAPYNISLNDALLADEVIILEKEGRPVAALIPMAEYDAFQAWREEEKRRQVSEVGQTIEMQEIPYRHFDLDDLAGTWSTEEVEAFEAVIADFEKIDERLWP